MCTNVLYLLSGLPPALTADAVDLLDKYRQQEVDLFDRTEHFYPSFLTRQWYPPRVALAMRRELIRAALKYADRGLHPQLQLLHSQLPDRQVRPACGVVA